MIDPATQHQRFLAAIDLLGGQRATARAIGINDRTLRALIAGEKNLHQGYLQDIATALQHHADACREAERQLSPLFTANLTQHQQDTPLHGHARARRAGN
jgi:hypothetical protein